MDFDDDVSIGSESRTGSRASIRGRRSKSRGYNRNNSSVNTTLYNIYRQSMLTYDNMDPIKKATQVNRVIDEDFEKTTERLYNILLHYCYPLIYPQIFLYLT